MAFFHTLLVPPLRLPQASRAYPVAITSFPWRTLSFPLELALVPEPANPLGVKFVKFSENRAHMWLPESFTVYKVNAAIE